MSVNARYPPALGEEESRYLLSTLKDWSIAHGLAVRPSPGFVSQKQDPSGVLAVTAPVTLFPSPFPKTCFEEGLGIQRAYNELYAAISSDEEWLAQIMTELVKVDDFMASLWEVHLKVKAQGYVQDLSLGLFRSDYMVHLDKSDTSVPPQIRQVEFNTISSSFGGLSQQVGELHKHLLRTGAYPPTPMLHEGALPENHSIASLAAGLGAAHKAYGSSKHAANLPLCVLFIVQDPERNIFDQRVLEYSLQSLSVPAFRLPFAEVLKYTKSTDHPSRALLYHPAHSPSTPYEVSVLYLRSTYTPTDFPDATSWTARLHLERSAAIKCPSILTHLAGSKKVQQVLATPDSPHLARFLKSPETVARIQNTFAAIYPLDGSPAGQEAKNLATDPEKCKGYVLKPQREGGGNNVYRSAIPGFLKSLGEESLWAGYVLMEIIEPPTLCNSLVREGEVKTGEVVGELGVYGTCLWRANGEILRNEEAGYLLRTKGSDSEEGGVAAGFGAVDSICLI